MRFFLKHNVIYFLSQFFMPYTLSFLAIFFSLLFNGALMFLRLPLLFLYFLIKECVRYFMRVCVCILIYCEDFGMGNIFWHMVGNKSDKLSFYIPYVMLLLNKFLLLVLKLKKSRVEKKL